MDSEESWEEALPKRAIGIRDSENPDKRDDEGRLILRASRRNQIFHLDSNTTFLLDAAFVRLSVPLAELLTA